MNRNESRTLMNAKSTHLDSDTVYINSNQSNRIAVILRNYAVVAAVVILFIVLAITSPGFLSIENILNIIRQASIVAIIAFAMTFVFIAGGFDLSVGSVFALGGALAAGLSHVFTVPIAMLIAVLAGGLVGFINGTIITKLGINAFVTTLASLQIVRGLALLYTDAAPIRVPDPAFRWLGAGNIAGVPVPVILMITIFSFAWFVLSKTKYGRFVYSTGSNSIASKIAGVRVDRIVVSTYVLTGLMAAFAGLIFAARIGVGAADVGQGLELSVIAAVLVGGTSLAGGEGSMWRTAAGAVFFALLANGFNLLNVPSFWQNVASGVIILVMVAVDSYNRKRRDSA
ncbi:MAG: hypothetical protein B5766_08005 [Candidatus Lumbricidophila eiseniae]|uniref:Ribose ABC transporter permease n=1 Tax=Candidatus Lumbricidiphila eiseniae TaxID=1969409 RepID=A0A2A6FQV7_9MICO|nr:MAG: hypothetical protein B5766_08005 [Candidatus Lumbricidophila eiseniae]